MHTSPCQPPPLIEFAIFAMFAMFAIFDRVVAAPEQRVPMAPRLNVDPLRTPQASMIAAKAVRFSPIPRRKSITAIP